MFDIDIIILKIISDICWIMTDNSTECLEYIIHLVIDQR